MSRDTAKLLVRLFEKEETLYRQMMDICKEQESLMTGNADPQKLMDTVRRIEALRTAIANIDIDVKKHMEAWQADDESDESRKAVEGARNKVGVVLKELMEKAPLLQEQGKVEKTKIAKKIQEARTNQQVNRAYQAYKPPPASGGGLDRKGV